MSFERTSSKFVIIIIATTTLLTTVGSTVLKLKVETLYKPAKCTETSRNRNLLTVHYTGSTLDGNVFDSSRDRNKSVTFRIGVGEAMLGWEQGLLHMCAGERRLLTIPPNFAVIKPGYKILAPSGTVLRYDIELLKLDKSPPLRDEIFNQSDSNGDKKLSRDEMRNHVRMQEPGKEEGNDIKDDFELLKQQKAIDKAVEDTFEREDRDGDGFITFAELFGPKYDEF